MNTTVTIDTAFAAAGHHGLLLPAQHGPAREEEYDPRPPSLLDCSGSRAEALAYATVGRGLVPGDREGSYRLGVPVVGEQRGEDRGHTGPLVGGSILRESRFFFQAEDGIRDYKVTGVQTCALPI